MLKSILNATGIPQNLERFRTELEREASVQIQSVKSVGSHIAMASIWGFIAVVLVILALITGVFLAYALLEPLYGRVGALSVIFVVLAIISLSGAMIARAKVAAIPARPELKLPHLFQEATHVASSESPYTSTSSNNDLVMKSPGSLSGDPLFNWLFSVARDAAPTPATGDQRIDQLFSVLKPKAEIIASEAMTKVVDRLRHGDRKTMVAILGSAVLAGLLASRGKRGKV